MKSGYCWNEIYTQDLKFQTNWNTAIKILSKTENIFHKLNGKSIEIGFLLYHLMKHVSFATLLNELVYSKV